jgi:hypothetical protein
MDYIFKKGNVKMASCYRLLLKQSIGAMRTTDKTQNADFEPILWMVIAVLLYTAFRMLRSFLRVR